MSSFVSYCGSWLPHAEDLTSMNYYTKLLTFGLLSNQTPEQKVVVEVLPLGMMMISKSSRFFVRVAGLSGALAVAMGAYGAHGLYNRDDVSEERKKVFEAASRYHFLHTLALLGVPLCNRPMVVGTLLATGTLIFSGTCYYQALTGDVSFRKYTPTGGSLLIAGWLAMVL